MANDNEDKQAQIDALQATVARLEEQIAAMQQRPPPPSPTVIPSVQQQNQHVQQQIPAVPQNSPSLNEDWFRNTIPTQPPVQVALGLDQATQDKLAKVDQLEDALRKTKNFKDYTFDLEELLDGPKIRLPDQFKMPKIDRFDGTGNPKGHVHTVINTLQPLGLSSDQMAVLFPRTLTGSAQEWYLTLEPAITKDWKSTVNAFRAQYSYLQIFAVTVRDLRMTKQGPKESFKDFLKRWLEKASGVSARPEEEELVRMVIQNSQTVYWDRMYYQSIQTFERLSEIGILIDDAIRDGRIVEEEPLSRKRSSSVYSEHQESYDVNSLYASSTTASSHKRAKKGNDRQFTPIKMSLSAAFHLLVQKGHLQPLQPGKPPKRPPPGFDESKFCDFHQERGHATDGCKKLRHAIQDLVDNLPHPNSLHFLGLN